jgi:hypothetical protein
MPGKGRERGKEIVGDRELQKAGSRKKRPNQLPPEYNREATRSRSEAQARGEASSSCQPADQPGQNRVEAQAASWDAKRPLHVALYTANFPLLTEWRQEEDAAQLERLKGRCEAALSRHSCCQASGGNSTCLQRTGTRRVYYVGFTCSAALDVPAASCSTCGASVTVHAYDVGCAPSAPEVPNYWIDAFLLDYFKPLQAGGVSVECKLCRGGEVHLLSSCSLPLL